MNRSMVTAHGTERYGIWDPISLQILWSRLIAIVDEAAATLIRTSFSTVVREAHDFACMLMDARGGTVANSTISIPVFLGTMSRTMAHFLRRYPLEEWTPGDVAITNDPWICTGHLRDISIARPVFHGGQLVAFAASTAHMPDIGGTIWSADAREVFEEGLRIPMTKLFTAGVPNEQLLEILEANVRVPDQVLGDLFAMVSAVEIMGQQLNEFLDEEDITGLGLLSETIQDLSEQRMRQAIHAVSDGIYHSEVWADGPDEHGLRIACAITVDGDNLRVDYTGSSPQVRQAVNCVLNHTFAYSVAPLKCLFDPLTPYNEGALRPLSVTAPEGTILNPRFPAAVDARSLVSHYIHAAIFSALAPAVPDRVIGHSGGPGVRAVFSGFHQERPFWTALFAFGGMGARASKDGLNSTSFPTIASNPPIEILERSGPIVVLEKVFIPDSAGPGRHRGGCAHGFRVLIASDHPIECSLMAERTRHPALGVAAGGHGSTMVIYLNDGKFIDPRGRTELHAGDILTIRCPGGGGYGDPRGRPLEQVARDVFEGYVTSDAAVRDYGADAAALDVALAALQGSESR